MIGYVLSCAYRFIARVTAVIVLQEITQNYGNYRYDNYVAMHLFSKVITLKI